MSFKNSLQEGQLHIVAPSRWLIDEAQESSLIDSSCVHFIPHGIDEKIFKPRNTSSIRRKLEIPRDKKIILFVAQSSSNTRKGFDHLLNALSLIDSNELVLVSVGSKKSHNRVGLQHVNVGYIESNKILSGIYSMADIFVIPSLQEAFGLTALEAMACGTPIVGFDSGGISDMVRPGMTGWLADTGNATSLREAIEQAVAQDNKRHQMAKRCRKVVEKEYTLKRQAKCYESLYRSIIDHDSEPSS